MLLKRWLSELRFTRTLAAVLLANLTALVILNAFRLRPAHLLLVYPLALGGFWWGLSKTRVRRARQEIPGWMIAWALAFAAFLTVPRLPYLLEWIPGNVVLAQADDWARLPELVSMTLSERYPLRHFANQDYLLSHYYAALYPMAFFKTLLPVITLKDAIIAGNLLYHLLLAMSLLELSFRFFTSRRSAALFFFLATLFGGFDWLFQAQQLFSHAEFWPHQVLGARREVSSYFTGMYWVVHHFVAFYSLVLAVGVARWLGFRRRAVKTAVLGLLVINAFYSSVFAFLPALLLGRPELLRLLRRTWRTRTLPLLAVVFLVPLFLYTNRVEPQTLALAPVHLGLFAQPLLEVSASFLAYVLLVSVVDLAGIPLLLGALYRRFDRRDRRYFLGAMVFLASTYCVESIGFNNYAMRGMFLPVWVFYYLLAKHAAGLLPRLRRGVVAALGLVLSFGTFREWTHLSYQPLMHSYWYWHIRGREPPPQVTAELRPIYRDLARDRSVRFYAPSSGDLRSMHKYSAEKMLRGVPAEKMLEPERELLRNRQRNWFW